MSQPSKNTRRAFLHEREADVRRWYEEGRSDREIGAALGKSHHSVRTFRIATGIGRRGTAGSRMADIEGRLEDIVRWARAGKSYSWMARRIGCSIPGVRELCQRRGIRIARGS